MWRSARTVARPTRREFTGPPADDYQNFAGVQIPNRSGGGLQGAVHVTEDKAMRHSGVWAALRLRADLVSTFPVGVFRDFDGLCLEMPKPPIMVDPGGIEWDFVDWMWASQRDLDLAGNVVGIIRARNGISTPYYPDGLPALIELQDTRICSVIKHKGQTLYRIGAKTYQPGEIYHEKQYPISGAPVGASPLIYAAASVGEYLSLQQYGLDWFAGGGVPKAWMKNTVKRLQDKEREGAKSWYEDTIRNGDLMVTGNDWEYNMIQAEQAGMEWLEGRRSGLLDISRFFGVPADLIDAAISGQSITYANMTQRNLQFLIMNLGPAVIRREKNLTKLLPQPRYVKLNTDALLRLDPLARQQMIRSRLETWQATNSEARELEDLPPLNAAQLMEMQTIYGRPLAGGVIPSAAAIPGEFGGANTGGARWPEIAPAPAPAADPQASGDNAPESVPA